MVPIDGILHGSLACYVATCSWGDSKHVIENYHVVAHLHHRHCDRQFNYHVMHTINIVIEWLYTCT